MAYYVYIIQSEIDKSFYKGFSTDPMLRLKRHNNKESNYTSRKVPWQLVYLEIYLEKAIALKREKAIKHYSHQQIEDLIKGNKNFLTDYLEQRKV